LVNASLDDVRVDDKTVRHVVQSKQNRVCQKELVSVSVLSLILGDALLTISGISMRRMAPEIVSRTPVVDEIGVTNCHRACIYGQQYVQEYATTQIGIDSRSLKPLRLESGREIGRKTSQFTTEGSDALRPHWVSLHGSQLGRFHITLLRKRTL
jgi:hypothetical protein